MSRIPQFPRSSPWPVPLAWLSLALATCAPPARCDPALAHGEASAATAALDEQLARRLGAGIYEPAHPAPTPAKAAADYQPPAPVTRAALSYPETARLNRIEGVVKVLLTVDETGAVVDTAVLSGSGSLLLDEVAREHALMDWKFRPATLHGRPVTGTYTQEIEFRLDPREQQFLEKKRAALPVTAGTPDPPYPEAARAKSLAGRLSLLVTWNSRGLVDHVFLTQSSGHGLLDRAAMRFAYENWRVDRSRVKEEKFIKTIEFSPPK